MADYTAKQYLDLTGLSKYDELIKKHIKDADDVINAKSIKTVLLDGDNIKFFKKENATLADTADYTVAISSSDVNNLKTRVGMNSTLNAYQTKDNLTDIVNVLTGANTVDGSVAKALKDAKEYTDTEIGKLDTTADVTIATETAGVVTIKAGVKEVDGIIAQGTGSDITLAKVATTGAAEDVSVKAASGTDTTSGIAWSVADADAQAAIERLTKENAIEDAAIATLNGTVDTAGSVLKAIKDNAKDATYDANYTIAQKIAAVSGAAGVTVEKLATAESGYLSTYVVKQNNVQVGDKINIPKDYLVKSAELKTVTEAGQPYSGAKVGDKYLDFVVNTKDAPVTDEHIYIPVNDLFDSYTSGSAAIDAVVVVVDNDTNKISATVTDGTIARAKIDADFEADIKALENTHAKETDGSFKSVATEITDKISLLDASVSQTAGADGLALSVTEVDGKITAISGSIAANTYDAYGEANAVYTAIQSIPEASITALFSTSAE